MKVGDVDVSRIGLGTNRLTHTRDNVALIRAAVDAGLHMIDTAHLYTNGQSEDTIGEALSLGESERSRFARRTIAHVACRYTRQAMCARTIEVYEELLFPGSTEINIAAQ